MVGLCTDNCWICGKPVLRGEFAVDEFGFAFHHNCSTTGVSETKQSASGADIPVRNHSPDNDLPD
jgi:hypothetical protein